MIKSIRLDGFRHFHDLNVRLRSPYTLISGLNGTGKTTVIEILNRLQRFLINSLPVFLSDGLPNTSLCSLQDIPAWKISDYGACELSLSFEMESDDVNYSYSLTVKVDFKGSQGRVENELLTVNSRPIFKNIQGEATVHSDDDRTFTYPVDWSGTGLAVAERNSSKIRAFLRHIKNGLFSLSINPYNIFAPHKRDSQPEPILNFDASNFTAWYHYLTGQEFAAVAQAANEMSAFIPGFRQFAFYPPEAMSRDLAADIFVPPNKKYRLPFNALSHGQKILAILHLLVRVAPANATIAIDELENFLAPTELQPLYDAFQDAYEDRDIQFILISHHPKTLSWYTDSAIVLSFAGNPPTLQARNFCEEDEAPEQSLIEFLSESE